MAQAPCERAYAVSRIPFVPVPPARIFDWNTSCVGGPCIAKVKPAVSRSSIHRGDSFNEPARAPRLSSRHITRWTHTGQAIVACRQRAFHCVARAAHRVRQAEIGSNCEVTDYRCRTLGGDDSARVRRGSDCPKRRAAGSHRSVRPHQECLRRSHRREEAGIPGHQGHVVRARSPFRFPRHRSARQLALGSARRVRRTRNRSRYGRRSRQDHLPDRRHAGLARRVASGRLDHQARQHRNQGPHVERSDGPHAWETQHQHHAHIAAQGRGNCTSRYADARADPHQERQVQADRAGLRLRAPDAVPGALAASSWSPRSRRCTARTASRCAAWCSTCATTRAGS